MREKSGSSRSYFGFAERTGDPFNRMSGLIDTHEVYYKYLSGSCSAQSGQHCLDGARQQKVVAVNKPDIAALRKG